MIQSWHKWCLLGTGLFLAVFVGPVIICELDIRNSALDAADVLSYYGTILSACIAIATLTITIRFTQRQIRREAYLASKTEKWEKIENILAKILDDLNPMRLLLDTANGMTNPDAVNLILHRYQISCKIANDRLLAYLSNIDYPHVKALIDAINKASEAFCETASEMAAAYSMLCKFSHQDTAKQTLKAEAQNPGSFDKDILLSCKTILEETNHTSFDNISHNIMCLRGKMCSEYQTTYRELLQLKGQTFYAIHAEIQKSADRLLHFGKMR